MSKKTPSQAADTLRGLHRALMGDHGMVLHPAASLAFDAAKQAAAGRPTPQAPNLARSWFLRAKGDTEVIEAGSSIAFSGHSVYTDSIQRGILFGSNKSPQFHRPHGSPSWAWTAMEQALAPAKLEAVLEAALQKATR